MRTTNPYNQEQAWCLGQSSDCLYIPTIISANLCYNLLKQSFDAGWRICLYGLSLDGWKKYRSAVCIRAYPVVVGIAKSWDCVADPRKKVGNAITGAWFWIGKMRENTKGFPVGVGTVSIWPSAADLKRKVGSAITGAESSMRKRQSNRKFEFYALSKTFYMNKWAVS